MSENQDAQEATLEGFVPESKTPPEETPSTEAAPEEQSAGQETPAKEADSTPEAAEKESGKTLEQRTDDAKHWQTKYQQQVESGKRARQELQAEKNILGDEAAEKTVPPQVGGRDLSATDVGGMSDEQLNETLRENPLLAMQIMQEQTSRNIRNMLLERDKELEAHRAYELEKDRAGHVLNRYVTDNNVSMEEIEAAKAEMTAMGFKASPRGQAAMLIKEIEHQRLQKHLSERAQAVAVETSQKIKQQALTQQPEGGQPAPPKQKTQGDIIVDKFARASAKKPIDGFFDI